VEDIIYLKIIRVELVVSFIDSGWEVFSSLYTFKAEALAADDKARASLDADKLRE
jgi:hypothetical protein